ncbi:MAG: acyl-CoA thioesterase [Rubrobacteraceae bacterium]|uniref:acyl-CoA thioesterase n=1 Tax=Rubrobacter naiadicus TaxID=1392641 RepID=UPI002360ED44|nr:thioesterase family protein [Rubrobacter naiadicus]MBX6764445.1 acyl-CoA thioesterase [Rubrobacteraceae bacterium]MCL6439171.1 acyl-CoA thioesterase [Rubrobacteraceae bacterium]
MEGYRFTHTLRVRYSEIDGQKVVYNAHYLTYLDVAITEYFRKLGIEFTGDPPPFDIALVKATLEFKRPARLDDLLDVGVRVRSFGRSSFVAGFRISAHEGGEETILEAEVVYVSYSQEEEKAVPVPEWVRARVKRFEESGALPG